ncbi:MAG: YihY/virulence factor BrkB family protein [Dehalococcoidia bacterium]
MVRALYRTAIFPFTALTSVVPVTRDAFQQYAADHCGTYAAAIAYYTLFSMVPMALVVVSILGLIVEPTSVVDFLFELFPLEETEEVRSDIQQTVESARAASPGVLIVSTGVLVWSASGVFGAVRRGISVATGGRGQPFLHGKLLDITLVPAVGMAILLGLGILTAVQIAIQSVGGADATGLHQRPFIVASHVVVTAVAFGAFALLYRLIPEQRPGWTEAVWAASVTAVLLEIAKAGAGYIIANAPFLRDNALYASISTALTLLFWVFVAASIMLFGAEFGRRVVRGDARAPLPLVIGEREDASTEIGGQGGLFDRPPQPAPDDPHSEAF